MGDKGLGGLIKMKGVYKRCIETYYLVTRLQNNILEKKEFEWK